LASRNTVRERRPRVSTIRCVLHYRGIDRVELKAGGTNMAITDITVLIR
jgi:hypothetical protein